MAKRGHGDGSWRDRPDGTVEYRVTINGRRRSFYGKDKKTCREKVDAARLAAQQGLPIVVRSQTVGRFLTHWLETTRPPATKEQTWERNESAVRVHIVPALGHLKLTDLSPQHIQALYRGMLDKGRANNTVVRVHAVLHKALGQAVKWNLIPRNPSDAAETPRVERREMGVLRVEQAVRLIDEAGSPVTRALYAVAIMAGLRRGELLALRWEDLDLDRGVLAVRRNKIRRKGGGFHTDDPKSRAGVRTIRLGRRAVDSLRRWRAEQAEARLKAGPAWEDYGLVFTTSRGTPLVEGNVTRAFKHDKERAGIPASVRLHDLRHTFATISIENGTPMKALQAALGHSTISTTMDVYAHLTPAMEESVAANLDRAFGAL